VRNDGPCRTAGTFDLRSRPTGATSPSSTGPLPGANPAHGNALVALITKGKGKGLRLVAAGGAFCTSNTANRGISCVKDAECGAVCGDGKLEAPEQCDYGGYGYGSGQCAAGEYCAYPGTANQCTCLRPTCGNGIVEPFEDCDGPDLVNEYCGTDYTCGAPGAPAACRCVPPGSPSGAFVQ
jgi:hypothetical protein